MTQASVRFVAGDDRTLHELNNTTRACEIAPATKIIFHPRWEKSAKVAGYFDRVMRGLPRDAFGLTFLSYSDPRGAGSDLQKFRNVNLRPSPQELPSQIHHFQDDNPAFTAKVITRTTGETHSFSCARMW